MKWRSVEDPGKKNTWNWVAFFFATFWLAYRKMYKPFFIIAGLQLLWTVPIYFTDLPAWLDLPFYGIISIIVGSFGNNHTNHVLKQARALHETVEDSYIQTKGGTHVGIMLGFHALLFALFFAMDFGLSFIPTETNIKDVVRISEEADTLEAYMDDP
ncbi:DUF2628 domain-containing protein [Fictibacillus nanhaiensis]|uniref:DUF2628 domain-containing protein n=1 Tax=Fictibacillus nanhaiensis TaxID=742169 RepID=UPI00296E57FF